MNGGASAEYRIDEKGNRVGPIGLAKGYLVTSGYALSCIRFYCQAQSKFRYLGEETIDSRETNVLDLPRSLVKLPFSRR
jgi:hypothetical protein